MNKKLPFFSNGAHWVRVDFHLHSPHVHSFVLPAGVNLDSSEEREKISSQYISQLKKENILVGAITDYQQIRKDWFTLLREKAEQEDIFLFPGIELSIEEGKGVHILIIFEYDENIDGINRFISALDRNPQEPFFREITQKGSNHRNINSNQDVLSILKRIRENFNCLIVIPHPEDDKGLIRSISLPQVAGIIQVSDAIEYISEQKRERLFSTNKIPRNFFDTFAMLENSDPKSIAEIGTKQRNGKKRATYLKLSSFSIDAFKIALHDPQTRVRLYEKPEFFFDRITSIKITGSSFLKNIHIDFNPELNTFIGGRGVGKSAIIETLRYALNLPIYSDASFRTEFVQSVVGSGGLIEVEIERFFGRRKQKYTVRRIVGKSPEVFDADEEKLEMEPADIFENQSTPIILGQKELYSLSLKTEFQLHLIDQFIGEAVSNEIRKFQRLLIELKDNAREILKLKEKLAQKEEYQQRLETINAKIRTFERLQVAEKLQSYTEILRDEKKLLSTRKTVEEILSNFQETFTDAEDELFSLIQTLESGKSAHRSILLTAAKKVEELKELLTQHQRAITEQFQNMIIELNALYKEWEIAKTPIEKEAVTIKQRLQQEGLEPDKYDALIQEKLRIEPFVARLEKIEKSLINLLEQRKNILQKVKEQRHTIFQIRKEQIEKLNQKLAGRIKLEVVFEGEIEKFKEELIKITRGAKIQQAALEAILNDAHHTMDGIELASYVDNGEKLLQEQFHLTEAQAKRFVEWFSEDQRRFELETLFPEDKIIIKLKINETFEELKKLSAGQKATALLLLLFAQENRILVIDQPEEDLDNRFIYEDVVKILRGLKGKKQIILATHNANIPVLGDAEQIVVLDAVDETCQIVHTGSIDVSSIREDVKEIMEGGEEAFQKRAQKYGEILNE